ncbi:uncharacterized protein E0L32_010298 [Thyridium curvatum]|uniref:Major facilitator superfamily (MFS) profile domain-containing protein n=1 Tax=Thyridium curvatum TaxID=1093900 RepID=A0A507ALG2_9PEZI|nr:uncharacterized protein E0L32_010298 [Thyridium curvatum]TPX07967.1 hypothetical protein E0L32_010298 [Thyridium curvatum]
MASKNTHSTPTGDAYDPEKPPHTEDLSPDDEPKIANDYPEGGTQAWLVAAGTAGVLFATLGYTNSFGVFQAYYMLHQLQHETSDRIAWIGSLQAFLIFATGCVGGPLFDRYGARVIRPAAALYVFAIMMTSLCSEYWQFMLAQGVLTGVADGLLMFPAMAATPQYFHKKRGAAMGVAIVGSSVGAIVFPIIMTKMLNESSLGFGWSVRIVAFIMVPVLVFCSIVIKARLPPRKTTFLLLSAFKEPVYNLLVIGNLFLMVGMFVPMFFLPAFAIEKGMNDSLAFYLVAMLNGASIPGRIVPGILADKFGRLNMLFGAGLSTSIIILCWSKLSGTAGIIIYTLAFGFCSGTIVSGGSVALSLVPKNQQEVGTYLGMGMAIAGVSALIGPPATGALLDRDHNIHNVAIFAGICCLGGTMLILWAKMFTEKGILGKV